MRLTKKLGLLSASICVLVWSFMVEGISNLAHEVPGSRADGDVVRELQIDPQDALVGLGVALSLERGDTEQELVAQHPQAPNVHAGIMVLTLHQAFQSTHSMSNSAHVPPQHCGSRCLCQHLGARLHAKLPLKSQAVHMHHSGTEAPDFHAGIMTLTLPLGPS